MGNCLSTLIVSASSVALINGRQYKKAYFTKEGEAPYLCTCVKGKYYDVPTWIRDDAPAQFFQRGPMTPIPYCDQNLKCDEGEFQSAVEGIGERLGTLC